ncbi:MAG: HlyD family secretion protein [Bacteroidales bacterium]|nr:HlyD family secretion protein [Bacteroidales bacterium]
MKHKQRTLLVNIIVVALILVGLVWIFSLFLHPGSKAWTNNAQVRRDLVAVNSRVQGFASSVHYSEYDEVQKGDTLVIIEDAQYRLQVAQAEAALQNALAGSKAQGTTIRTAQNNITVSDAELDEVRLQIANAEKEYNRYKQLLAGAAVTQQQFDNVETRYKTLKARYDRLLRQQQSTRLVQNEQSQRLDQNQAAIQVAEATLQQARLNLGYTVVTAPCSGRLGRKAVQEGELVHPGQLLAVIVSNADCWVDANFRERQLKNIKEGAEVRVKVDALGGKTFTGRVASVADATGGQFSAVPQDNSTGNFVKVEQLIPVKIALPASDNNTDDLALLKSGMNVECKVVK